MDSTGDIVIYDTGDGQARLDVHLDGETVWLTQTQMAELFGVGVPAVAKHIANIIDEDELVAEATISKMEQVRTEGVCQVGRTVSVYDLDMIVSVGYRVNSRKATRFRQWATGVLREYLVKGFAMDDGRLKDLGGGGYWRELLDRIRDIRSSEKVLYRQVLDVYATAVDYDPSSAGSQRFLKIVQDRPHFAAHGHTAAEAIYERADADRPFMGLRTFRGDQVTLADARIAKNHLDADELKMLNQLVSGYFDLAEARARQHVPTYMADYVTLLDTIMQAATGRPELEGAGNVSHVVFDGL